MNVKIKIVDSWNSLKHVYCYNLGGNEKLNANAVLVGAAI